MPNSLRLTSPSFLLLVVLTLAGGLLLSSRHVEAQSTNSSPEFPSSEDGVRSVYENTGTGVDIGSPVGAIDADADTLTYTLGGEDQQSFIVVGSTGQLRTRDALDYEEKDSYTVIVSVSDGMAADGNPDSATDDEITVTVTVVDVDEAGTVSFFPDAPQVGTFITATLHDPDGVKGELAQTWEWARSSDKSTWEEITDFGTHVVSSGRTTQGPAGRGRISNYAPTDADQGMYLRAKVTYEDKHGSNKSVEMVSDDVVGDREPAPDITVVELVTGLTIPWGISLAPDGTMLFTERGGKLSSRLTSGTVQTVTADFSDVHHTSTIGLLGIVVDPAFTSNRRFYTCQARNSFTLEVIAWTIDDTYTSAVRVDDPLIGDIPANRQRGGCRLRFGPEGYLWITTGDANVRTHPQDLDSLGGKVLRVDPSTGTSPTTNPFAPSVVYTYGHRNPQGLALRPGTNQMWAVGHGPNMDDEINLLVAAGNYGWDPDTGTEYTGRALMTALDKFPQAVEAKWSSGHPTIAPGSGIFLEGSDWGEWEGRLAVATLKTQQLRLFEFAADGTFVSQVLVPELDQKYGRLRTVELGPDGVLYVSTSNGDGTDKILKVTPTLAPTSGLVLSSDSPGELAISWDERRPVPTDYRVNWAKSSENFPSYTQNNGNAYPITNEHNESDLEVGVEYKVRVRARYRGEQLYGAQEGWSAPWSSTATITITSNTRATGAPTISGTARVGETLAASTSGIEDIDGLEGVVYSYQWVRHDGSTDMDISGATSSMYTLTHDEAGMTIKVRVSFNDDRGHAEILTSAATEALPEPLTGRFVNVPPYHNGTDAFAFELLFSEPLRNSLRGMVSYIIDVSGGAVDSISRVDGQKHHYSVTIQPSGSEDVTIGLEKGTGRCWSLHACTMDREPLSHDMSITVSKNSPATGAPTISGTAQVGQTLMADTADISDDDGLNNVSYSYQWVRNDGSGDMDISEATGSTYTLVSADGGKSIKVRVRFNDDRGNDELLTSAVTEALPEPLTGRFVNVPPFHNGTDAFTLEMVFSKPLRNSLQGMMSSAIDVSGGSVDSISRVNGQKHHYSVTIQPTGSEDVTISLEKGTGWCWSLHACTMDREPLSHDMSITVSKNSPAKGAPTISGTVQVGQTLTADTSDISDTDGLNNVSYSYQWVRSDGSDDTDISGETGSTYTLVSADQGKTIKVKVSFTDDEDNPESLTSAATETVAAKPNTDATGAPTISGTPQVGQTLTADTSDISDEDGLENVSYSYQWMRSDGSDDTDISGETASTYMLVSADQGKMIKVKVSFTDDEDNPESLTSAATSVVAGPPLTVSLTSQSDSHAGTGTFTFEMSFSEEPKEDFSYETLRDHAFEVTGGSVKSAERLNWPSNIGWRITVKPDGSGEVRVVLPATTDCSSNSAVCTQDGRKLSNSLDFTVAGPS